MREIKFRLWTPEVTISGRTYSSQMTYPSHFGSDDYSFGWSCHDYLDIGVVSKEPYSDEYRILMQYTGLKDKNGKEIYEGDILECPMPIDPSYTIGYEFTWWERGIVKYYSKFAKFGLEFYSPEGGEGYTGSDGILDYIKEWWVIGNIYETPELLNA